MSESSQPSPFATPLMVIGAIALGIGLYAVDYGIGLLAPLTYMDEEALMQGTIIGGVGAVALGAGLALRLHLAIMPLPLIAFAVPVGLSYQAASERQAAAEQSSADAREIFDAYLTVCASGNGMSTAAAYPQDAGVRPTLVYFQTTDGEWLPSLNTTPDEWMPETIGEAELVVCERTTERVLQTCTYATDYGSQFVPIIQYVVVVEVREALTGRLLLRDEVEGNAPPSECPATFQSDAISPQINGPMPPDEAALGLATRYVRLRGLTPPAPSIMSD